MTRISALVLVAAAVVCSCDGGITEVSVEGFTVRTEQRHLLLNNDRRVRVYYVALERELSHRMDLICGSTKSPSVEAGEAKRIRLGDLPGYHADARQAVVYSWSVGRTGCDEIVVDLK